VKPITKKKAAVASSLAFCSLVAVGLALPGLARRSNCGGNSAALWRCSLVAFLVRIETEENRGRFDLTKLSDLGKNDLKLIARSSWVRDAAILMRTNTIEPEHSDRLLIAVCDTAFNNVPQPTLWNGYKRTPGHAVAYADGSRGLISPEEFRKLDLSGFVSAKRLVAALDSPSPNNLPE